MLNGEFLRKRKDGSELWLQAAYTPLYAEDGSVEKVIKIATDISNVKFPVLQVSDILRKLSEGDFTQKSDIKSSGYVGEMGSSINVAIDSLNTLIGDIQGNSGVLETAAHEMLEMSTTMSTSTEEVSASVMEMAKGAENQTTHIERSSKGLEVLKSAAMEVSESTQAILKAARQGQENSASGPNKHQ